MKLKFLKTKFAISIFLTGCIVNAGNATSGVVAGYCTTTFVDGATAHGNGELKFEDSPKIINNPDAELAASKAKNLNNSECDPFGRCTISGSATNTLDLGDFEESADKSNNITVSNKKFIGGSLDDYPGTEFGEVTVQDEAELIFSADATEYHIEKLIILVGNDETATLELVPGDYYIGEFQSRGDTVINIEGDGDVRIFLRDHSDFEDHTQVNLGGEAQQLLIYGYKEVHIKNTSEITALIYSKTKIELKETTKLIGAASAGDEMKMKDDAVIDFSCDGDDDDADSTLYKITGHGQSITSDNAWSWNGSEITDWREAMENPSYFGPGGVVSRAIETVDLASLTDSSLANVDAFVSTWWGSSQSSDYHNIVRDFFLAGGDLVLMQDDTSHDGIGEFLGIETINGMSNPTTISSPLQDGPFGAVGTISINVGAAHLNNSQITALGGTICGEDQAGQATFACWDKDEFAAGAGKLVIIIDTEFITKESNEANYNSLNDKAKLALNVLEFLTRSPSIDHYQIEHDTQGFTCEAETVTIKACENADCTQLYDQTTQITLSPTGWAGSDTISFTGSISTTISYTSADTITMAKISASPDADLRCFNGDNETCNIDFVAAGFELFGENIGDSLADQLAENTFNNVNLRAVKDDGSGVCVALLDDGLRGVDLSFNCTDPAICKTDLYHDNIPLTELVAETISLDFSGGIASLGALNYADAGRLQLSASAVIDGATITSGSAQVDVLPASLALDISPTSIIYTGATDTDTYSAGESFNFSISAYGTAGTNVLPNYQPGSLQLKLSRNQPSALSAADGTLTYGTSGALSSSLSPEFTPATSLTFVDGVYSYSANYDDVGQISIDVRDDDYLGNVIASQDALTLGNFIPAYFSVTVEQTPQLADTCAAAFTYIGEEITFDTDSEAIIRVTGKNALDQTTNNYSSTLWSYAPNLADVNDRLSYMDSSSYASTGTATVVLNGQAPLVSDNASYNGSGLISIDAFRFRYNKVDVVNSAFDLVSPFTASIDMVFSADFLSDNGVCFKDNNADTDCNSFTIANITGANLRYGRMVLDNTYGPDREALTVNIKSEYYKAGQWLLNTDDNCTDIAFTETSGQLKLRDKAGSNIANLFDDVKAAGTGGGVLTEGQSNGNNDLFFSAPNSAGALILTLDPAASGLNDWPDYLNIDWDLDGNIDDNDFPSATVTFGQFRGNDRIIHWQEIFN
jgi:hypothetical protein